MMAFIRTLILAVSIFVLSHEADAVVSDMFESATGTEMRLIPIAQSIQNNQNQNATYAQVSVMPVYTKQAKLARMKSTIKGFFSPVLSLGKGISVSSSSQIPVKISPAKL